MKQALILRAEEDAQRTADKLALFGYQSCLSPVLEIHPVNANIPDKAYDAILVSSAKAFLNYAQLSAVKNLPLHAVGEKTAHAARLVNFAPQIIAGHAEAILPLLLQRYPTPHHFLYLAGRDRQPHLELGLRQAGHLVTTIEVYVAQAANRLSDTAISMISEGAIDAALHYSRRSAKIFLELIKKEGLLSKIQSAQHLALSKDVAIPLHEAGLSTHIAEKPDEKHMIDLMRKIII